MKPEAVFIDMDQVLTDFNAAALSLDSSLSGALAENAPQEQRERLYAAIEAAGIDFWANMAWTPEGQRLWDSLKAYNPVLLSSPGEFRYAEAGKQKWVSDNLPGTTLFLDTEKFRYAGRDRILIDDMRENIDAWIKAGGIGILHRDVNQTLKEFNAMVNTNTKLGKYIREEAKGIPGQPGYKPTLWYWITPDGRKLLVDQKVTANRIVDSLRMLASSLN